MLSSGWIPEQREAEGADLDWGPEAPRGPASWARAGADALGTCSVLGGLNCTAGPGGGQLSACEPVQGPLTPPSQGCSLHAVGGKSVHNPGSPGSP